MGVRKSGWVSGLTHSPGCGATVATRAPGSTAASGPAWTATTSASTESVSSTG